VHGDGAPSCPQAILVTAIIAVIPIEKVNCRYGAPC
jgi:hypothetical protein